MPTGRHGRALITGATSGIGAAFASALPSTTGLLLSGRNEQQLERMKSKLERPGRAVETVRADLSDAADQRALVERGEAFGVDMLINNAGTGQLGPILGNGLEEETATAMVNVVAVATLTRGLLPGMIERARRNGRRAGVIVVSSTAAFAPVPYFATYAATKAFDLHYGEALAEELRGEPVDVLVLCPGATRTAFGSRAGYDGGIPGAADPAEVAAQALRALGRRTVCVTGLIEPAAFAPLLAPRRLFTGLLGAGMRLAAGRRQR